MAKKSKKNLGNTVLLYVLCALVVIGIAAIIFTNYLGRNDMFTDKYFMNVISALLDKSPANVSAEDLANIKYLALNNASYDENGNQIVTAQIGYDNAIKALSDAEAISDVKYVALGDYLTDFSDIKYFTGLQALVISGTEIENLEFAKECTNLEYISVTSKKLTDISALSAMTKLVEAGLSGAALTDVSVLANCKELTGLFLDQNNVSDLSALSSLTKLENVDISGNAKLSDISFIANMTAMKTLAFDDTNVSDVSALANLTNLEQVSFANCGVSDISALEKLTKVTTLVASENKITDISAIAGMKDMKNLDLGTNEISDISALSAMTKLYICNLNDNKISDLTGLKDAKDIYSLNLLGNGVIKDTTPIQSLIDGSKADTPTCYVWLDTEEKTEEK